MNKFCYSLLFVFSISAWKGHAQSRLLAQLPKGIYILRDKNGARKYVKQF